MFNKRYYFLDGWKTSYSCCLSLISSTITKRMSSKFIYISAAACKCDLRGTQQGNGQYCFYKETPCKNVKGELITEEYLIKAQGEDKRRIWYSNCERKGDTLMNCPEKSCTFFYFHV